MAEPEAAYVPQRCPACGCKRRYWLVHDRAGHVDAFCPECLELGCHDDLTVEDLGGKVVHVN